MTVADTPPSPPAAGALAPLLADLGLGPDDCVPLGSGGTGAARTLAVRAGAPPVPDRRACLDAVGSELHGSDALLFVVEGRPTDEELAAWRNALWPEVHVGALYRLGQGHIVRETLQGSARVEGDSDLEGVVLAGRRTAHVLSPEATVEKFDQNAAGWDGDPGASGYPHFRWMRRYVGLFASVGPVSSGARILDFGSGAGWCGIEAALSSPGSELCAFDPSPEMVRIVGENAKRSGIERFTGRTGFGEDPPFPAEGEEPFDHVISSGVISFSSDSERWLDGLARTVRPGGRLVIGDIHRDSLGFRTRRRRKPLLPVREMNARTRDEVRRGLESRGFRHDRSAGYQLTWPIPQAMHLSETKLRGALGRPLLWANQLGAAVDRTLGSPLQVFFDSWVMSLTRKV